MLFIFDLDGTVIDSSHRALANADGSINLDHWRENSTAKMLAKDKLLPLANGWKAIDRKRHQIVVMTARVMGMVDYTFLINNGLYADFIYSRPEGVTLSDDILKRNFLISLKRDIKKSLAWIRSHAVMFDDNANIRYTMRNELIRAYDPAQYNKRFA